MMAPSSLPNEILSLILYHLNEERQALYQCTLVTKHFYATANPLLWKNPIRDNETNVTERLVAILLDASPQRLSELGQHIRQLRLYSPDFIFSLLSHTPHLEHLTLATTWVSSDNSFIDDSCQQLVSLHLDGCRVYESTFYAIGQHCHQLSHFKWRIPRCMPLPQSSKWLAHLASCPLTFLDISCYTSIDPKAIPMIQTAFPQLMHLKIKELPSGSRCSPVEPPTCWPHLISLEFLRCTRVEESSLIDFLQCHPRLQQLKLNMVLDLSDATLDTIAEWLPDIAYVDLGSRSSVVATTADGVRRLIYGCPRLIYLELHDEKQHALQDHFMELSDTISDIKWDQEKIGKIRNGNQVNTNTTNNDS